MLPVSDSHNPRLSLLHRLLWRSVRQRRFTRTRRSARLHRLLPSEHSVRPNIQPESESSIRLRASRRGPYLFPSGTPAARTVLCWRLGRLVTFSDICIKTASSDRQEHMINDHLYICAIDARCWTDISVGAPGYHTRRCGWLSQNGCLSAARVRRNAKRQTPLWPNVLA